ncbi:MAG TPA: DUF1648 domain-containing protein [Longimicrobiales bacterium]|nr:DUF1648 domain-containing protein [Longimicrobiales bacterium]
MHLITGVVLVATLGLSLYVYPELPERIPLHFAADGTPDRWGARSLLKWLLLPLIGAATIGLLYGVAWFLPGRPHLLNMPDKKKLLELPRPLQDRVLAAAVAMMYYTALALAVMFASIQYGAWVSATTGTSSSATVVGIIFALVVMPFVTIGFLVVIQRRLDEAWREYRTRSS